MEETRTEQWGPFEIHVKWEADTYPDLSWLGEYTDKPSGLYVDRKLGYIFNDDDQVTDQQRVYKAEEFDRSVAVRDDIARYLLSKDGYHCQEFEVEEADGLIAVAAFDCVQFYKQGLSTMGWGEYRYFQSPDERYNLTSRWKADHPEEYAELMAKHGSEEAYAAHCLAEDYQRMVDYNKGNWYMQGCVVTVTLDGLEVGYDALWGIESDAGDLHQEVEAQCVAEAKAQARTGVYKAEADLLTHIGKLKAAQGWLEAHDPEVEPGPNGSDCHKA